MKAELTHGMSLIDSQQFDLAMSVARVGTWSHDFQDNKVLWSDTCKELFGLPADAEITPTRVIELIHPSDREQVAKHLDVLYKNPADSDYSIEYRVTHPDGHIYWLNEKGRLIHSASGQIRYTAGIVIDITERKKFELQLQESEERLRLATEGAGAGTWYWDMMDDRFACNGKGAYLFGIGPEPVSSQVFIERINPSDRARVRHAIQQAIDECVDYKMEFRIRSSDDTMHDVFALGKVYFNVIEPQLTMMGIALDVTQQKRDQQEVVALKNLLEAKNNELETIIGVVSHDLRSPIVNIQGFSSELRKDCQSLQEQLPADLKKKFAGILSKTIPESLGYIENSATVMDRLVRSLVQVARIGLATVEPERLDIGQLLKSILSNLNYKFKQADTELHIGELPACIADRSQAIQIFTNLIDNAVKYLDPNTPGKISITGRVSGKEAIYCIKDNGIGISEKDHGKVWNMFFRVDSHLQTGEGIGLALVKRIVDRNNGRIWFESQLGKGTKFFIALPADNHQA